MNSRNLRRFLASRVYPVVSPAALIAIPARHAILSSRTAATVDGIGLVDLNFDHTDDLDFQRTMTDALALIRAHDPRRYAIVQREVRWVVNAELGSWGQYDRSLQACNVDFGRYGIPSDGDYPWYVAAYAALIIHEATHGRLMTLGFVYTRRYRARIERICRNEERRFAARLPRISYDFEELVPPFQEQDWHRSWYGGRVQHARSVLARVRQSREREARAGTDSTARKTA